MKSAVSSVGFEPTTLWLLFLRSNHRITVKFGDSNLKPCDCKSRSLTTGSQWNLGDSNPLPCDCKACSLTPRPLYMVDGGRRSHELVFNKSCRNTSCRPLTLNPSWGKNVAKCYSDLPGIAINSSHVRKLALVHICHSKRAVINTLYFFNCLLI